MFSIVLISSFDSVAVFSKNEKELKAFFDSIPADNTNGGVLLKFGPVKAEEYSDEVLTVAFSEHKTVDYVEVRNKLIASHYSFVFKIGSRIMDSRVIKELADDFSTYKLEQINF